jgi:hypothetical protein
MQQRSLILRRIADRYNELTTMAANSGMDYDSWIKTGKGAQLYVQYLTDARDSYGKLT